MRNQTTCDVCSHQFSASPKVAGKRVRCPECGSPVAVPETDDVPVSRSRSRQTRKPKKAQNQNGLAIGLAGAGGAVVVGLLVFFMMRSGPATLPPPPSETPVVASNPPVVPTPPAASTPPAVPGEAPMVTPANAHVSAVTPVVASNATVAGSSDTIVKTSTAASDESTVRPAPPRVKLDMVELIAKVEPSVVRITVSGPRGSGCGSGFVVDKEGTIVTNVHVMEGARKAEVEFPGGTTAPVVGFRYLDRKKDIAIIKIDLPAEKLTPLPLAAALPPKGTPVVAFGSPLGLSFTSSEGIISALRPAAEMKEQFGEDFQGDWIQTTTSISPGNSGGPLVNHFGEVVAMNTMQMNVGQNLNFAMSAVDIAEAISKAPAAIQPISPENLKSLPRTRSRSMASDETDTDRGRQLLSSIAEIFLLNATSKKTLALDPTGLIWQRVIVKSQSTVEKSDLELSVGEPSDDAAIMFVVLELKTTKKKTVASGTQELHITVEVICKDDFAKKGESKVCRIWKMEENLGTISFNALSSGTFPRTADEKLSGVFGKFRSACTRARASQKAAGDKSEKSGSSDKNAKASK